MSGDVVFVGSKQLGLRCLDALLTAAPGACSGVVTVDDRADGRSVLDAFQRFCGERGLPLTVARSRREADAAILAARPDVCVVVGWYWLIGADVVRAVPRGMVGLHNSLLPRYRGGAPLVWALMAGEPEVGMSLFTLTEGLDDGDVWGQVRMPVGPRTTIGDVLAGLEDAAAALVATTVPGILDGTATPVPQDHAQATFGCLRTPQDGWIDWSQPAAAIDRAVRAQTHPYPGAYTWHRDERVTVWRATPVAEHWLGVPGQVARVTSEGVHVVCGDGQLLRVEVVSLPGGDDVPAAEVITSITTRFPVAAGPLTVPMPAPAPVAVPKEVS